MQLAQFMSLDCNNRVALVMAQGTSVTSIVEGAQTVTLYVLPRFLAEVYYNPGQKQITAVEVLHPKDARLQLYLDKLSLAELMA